MDANLKSKLKKALTALGILFAVAAVLVGFYIYAGNYLPGSLQAAYQKKDCDTVLNNHSILSQFYPFRSVQENVSVLALECALYTNAQKLQESGKWLDAYQTYKTCAETYPDGVLASDAHEQAGISLLSQATEQQEQRAYAESVATLKRVMAEYPLLAEAADRYAEAHLSWGSEYQSHGEFQAAEGVLLSLQDWSQAGAYESHVENSQSALASLYLAWGESHQNTGELVPAMSKYRQAIEIAPGSESASLAAEKQVEILLAQGDAFMDAGNYQSAIEAYQRGVSEVNDAGKDRLNSATAQAYIAWSRQNVSTEDYYQALEKIETAAKLDLSASTIQHVESFKQELYTAFANSSGTQAKNLIQEVSRTSCKQEKKNAFPPVLGINSESALFALHGLDKALPENLIAKTPGELRYIVCVNVKSEIIESKNVLMVQVNLAKRIGVPQGIKAFTRTQFSWEISIFDLTTGQILVQKDIRGSEPAPLEIHDQDYFYTVYNQQGPFTSHPFPASTEGSHPDINDLIKLLSEIIS